MQTKRTAVVAACATPRPVVAVPHPRAETADGGTPEGSAAQKWTSAAPTRRLDTIQDSVRRAVDDPGAYRCHRYAPVAEDLTGKISRLTGVDVSGFERVVDTNAVRHTLNEHGDPATELPRGQLPVTEADLARLPEIVSAPDTVEPTKPSHTGAQRIVYTKRWNGSIYVVEEVRKGPGRRALALVTMRKYPSKTKGGAS